MERAKPLLAREEYVEQAFFFHAWGERLLENVAAQELLALIREEILATTKLPLAIDYFLAELKHSGVIGPALRKLDHYFTPFQTFVFEEAEDDRGRFDLRVALDILRREAEYRAAEPTEQGLFLYQFEALCRNRLRYDPGLDAIGHDPQFNGDWQEWIATVRRQIGIVDLADMIYVRSEHYYAPQARSHRGESTEDPPAPKTAVLFGHQEGRIALANRNRDPLLLFAALQRQLGYPKVPRPQPVDQSKHLLPQVMRRVERLEMRLKLLEEERQQGAINLEPFLNPPTGDQSRDELI